MFFPSEVDKSSLRFDNEIIKLLKFGYYVQSPVCRVVFPPLTSFAYERILNATIS